MQILLLNFFDKTNLKKKKKKKKKVLAQKMKTKYIQVLLH